LGFGFCLGFSVECWGMMGFDGCCLRLGDDGFGYGYMGSTGVPRSEETANPHGTTIGSQA
jgi:hypothetical protein